jgi:hypothetical protein
MMLGWNLLGSGIFLKIEKRLVTTLGCRTELPSPLPENGREEASGCRVALNTDSGCWEMDSLGRNRINQ